MKTAQKQKFMEVRYSDRSQQRLCSSVRVSLSSFQLQPAMILAFQLALCGLVQAIDEECLLARPTRTGTLEEDLGGEEDTGLDYKAGQASSEYFEEVEG